MFEVIASLLLELLTELFAQKVFGRFLNESISKIQNKFLQAAAILHLLS